jgi:AraC-like DNA-binding protein
MKELLADPSIQLSVLEIGLKVGFNSKTSMNRVFKQFENISPKEYQSRHRNVVCKCQTENEAI